MGFPRHSWESVANSFSRGSSQLRGQTHISGIMGSYSLQGTPRDIFPTRVNAEAESALVVLIWLQNTPQPQTSRNFQKTRFIVHKSYRVKSIPEPHNKVRDTEEGETENGPEVLLLLGSRFSQFLSLLVNLKQKREIKVREKKSRNNQQIIYLQDQSFLKFHRLILYLVMSLVICLFEMNVFIF